MIFTLFLLAGVFAAAQANQYPCDDEEWRYYNGYCYWSSIYHPDTKEHQSNWFDAARECRKRKSDLASIHDAGENHVVHRMNRCANTWTGLVMVNSALKTQSAGWEWFDASSRNYVNWKSGRPHNSYSECTYIESAGKTGSWDNAQHCGNVKNYYVCKKQALGMNLLPNMTGPNFHKVRGPCQYGWFVLGDKCYNVNTTKVDYFAAMVQCQSVKGKLVTLHSSKDDADLTRIFDACDTPWIGIENTDPNKVGVNSGWRWADGTVVDYHNWKVGGITNDQTKQCGLLQRGAKWDNVHCWELHPFVCEKPRPE